MNILKITLWSKYEVYSTSYTNAEGRLDIGIAGPEVVDRVTIEPYDPDSKVEFTHYGAKYTP